MAVSNFIGSTQLLVNLSDSGLSRLHKRKFYDFIKPKIKVEAITLPQIFIENAIKYIDFLKMDCEGSEWDIFINDETCLEKINKIALEFHEERGHSIGQLSKILSEKGFKVNIKKTKAENLGFFRFNLGFLYAENKH